MEKTVWDLSNEIEQESFNLNVVVCQYGSNFTPGLKQDLERILSLIGTCRGRIDSERERLKYART